MSTITEEKPIQGRGVPDRFLNNCSRFRHRARWLVLKEKAILRVSAPWTQQLRNRRSLLRLYEDQAHCPGSERGAALPGPVWLSKKSGGVCLARANRNKAWSGDLCRHDAEFAGRRGAHAARFEHSERTHVGGGIVKTFATVEADFVGFMLECEWACQMLVAATKDGLVEKVENYTEDFHELALSFPPRNRAADRTEATTTGALSGGTAVHV